jgi:PAS domain S-box-containing protein
MPMQIILWIVTLISVAAASWCIYRLSVERRRFDRSQISLRQVVKQLQDIEANHHNQEIHRETTEEKLRNYLRLLDALINTMPSPVYFKDGEGIYQGCNKMFAGNILGLTRDRIIGRRPQELTGNIPSDLAALYQREEMKMMEKRGFHSFEAPVQCADGIRRDFLFTLAPVMDVSGQADGCVAVLADLTDKNRAAQDRLEREKLEGVLETAGAVCHELNQPLQALSGFTEILAVKTDEHAEAWDYLAKIMDQIERIGYITAKLQGITRYEAMEYTNASKIIDINKSSD